MRRWFSRRPPDRRISLLGPYPPRTGRLTPGIRVHALVRHAVFCRDGHRPDVLRRGRTPDPLHQPAGRRRRNTGGRAAGYCPHLFPLGHSCLGNLCRCRPVAGLFYLSARPSADDPFGPLSADRRPDLWLDRSHRGYDCHTGHIIWRRDIPRLWRDSDQCRPQHALRHSYRHQCATHSDRGHHGHGHPLRPGRP